MGNLLSRGASSLIRYVASTFATRIHCATLYQVVLDIHPNSLKGAIHPGVGVSDAVSLLL